MKSISLRFVITILLAALCAWALYAKPIRFGKDLRGGVSLIYSVKVPKDARAEEVLAQVIDVLKERVNPQGVLDIAMQPQGLDRIEVVMPLPSAEVRELQLAFKSALEELMRNAQVSPTALDQALAAGKAVEQFGSLGTRGDDLRALQKAYDDNKAATADLAKAKADGADTTTIGGIEDRLVTSELAMTALKKKLLGQVLAQARLVKALGLSTEPAPVRDAKGELVLDEAGRPTQGPSQRENELNAIKTEFPHLADAIASLVTKYDAYASKRTGLDDPEDLMRLLRGAGVLDFRIAVTTDDQTGVNVAEAREQLAKRGPKGVESGRVRWFEINDLKQWYETPAQLEALQRDPIGYFAARRLVAASYAGSYYLLLYTTDDKAMTHDAGGEWSLTQVFPTTDSRLGGSAVGFHLDQGGASRMARLTGGNVGKPMAIVLDDQVYSAPNLNSQISSQGVITGQFDKAEIAYLIRVLAAGSLSAGISPDPISMNVLGPSIGADNLEKGKEAILLSVAFTCVVMVIYYFGAGLIACVGLALNTLMIFGIMAAIDGTFTLPGLAGIALSVAMAVDANVLIYERIREEMVNRGESLRNAVDLGFGRALSAIIDGNITNLIAVVVLYKVGATEVKGFALTMCIGVLATLFTGLFVTRTFFMAATDWFGVRRLPMLPTVVPAVTRLLTPTIDWLKLRPILWTGVLAVTFVSIVLTFWRGNDIFETEFRGGVSMTLSTRAADPANPKAGKLMLGRDEVENRVRNAGTKAGPENPIVYELRNANVLVVGEAGDGGKASSFQIRVGNPPGGVEDEAKITRSVVEAVVQEFRDQLAVQLPLSFKGEGDADHTSHTFALEKDLLGDCINRPGINEPLGDFRGGVAVVVDNINPPTTPADVENRISRMRSQPDFSEIAGRRVKAIGLTPADVSDPTKGYTSMAILVNDPLLSSISSDFEAWDRQMAAPEWKLVSSALAQQATLDEVSSFSPVVAENLAASAVVAVILSLIGMLGYIWVRFGSFRFSAAAIASLCFNVIVCLGFIAAAPWLAHTGIGRALYIDEFRIDINVIAALLTIVGYAINDTIVILDRIRENRGKLPFVTRACVNDSINQTFSRTVLTGGSTFATAVILIALGGTGIRPFAYTFFIGLVAGTISSVIVAAPFVYSRKEEEEARRRAELGSTDAIVPSARVVPN